MKALQSDWSPVFSAVTDECGFNEKTGQIESQTTSTVGKTSYLMYERSPCCSESAD